MSVDSTHCEYDRLYPLWERVRDFVEGEKCVKKSAVRYVPKLDAQLDPEYEAYVKRGKFLNATGRTLEGMVGLVFSKDPEFNLPAEIEAIESDADMAGNSLYAYCRTLLREVMTVGRGGSLVDWSDEDQRASIVYYTAERILNWQWQRINGKSLLSLVVLSETETIPNQSANAEGSTAKENLFEAQTVNWLRVLRLVADVSGPRYIIERWRENEKADKKEASEWTLEEVLIPTRIAKPLNEIPFVFHGTDRDQKIITRPPLDDVASLNESHFRLSCDLYHGLHFTALPTPWAVGFDSKAELKIGSSVAWVTDNEAAKTGYLEFTGTGLGAIRQELQDTESSMAVMGARLLETQKRAAETAEAMAIRQSGDSAVLTGITGALSDSLTKALRWAQWWTVPKIERPEDIDEEDLSVEINTDFAMQKLGGAELTALVSSWIQKGISFKTLFFNLKQGQVIPSDRTEEEEASLIATEGPPGMELEDEEPEPKPEPGEKNPPAE